MGEQNSGLTARLKAHMNLNFRGDKMLEHKGTIRSIAEFRPLADEILRIV